MANEYNTLITFESKNQIEFMRFYEFVREIKDIERYGIVNFKGMNFLNGGYATFEIKVVGYNDPGIEPFLKIIHDGFPDVSLYYTSTDRCDYYLTNDENGKYYPFHYEVEVYSDNPTVTHCARFVSESYEGIQDFLKRKYNYELGNGDLDVPVNYVTEDGIKLHLWLQAIKCTYRNKGLKRKLTNQQIEDLEKIGIDWRTVPEIQWERGYNNAKEYYEEHGDLLVPISYVTKDGQTLGRWIRAQREKRDNGKLKAERIKMLDALNMDWVGQTVEVSWENRYKLAKDYYLQHGNLNLPSDYKTKGIWLAKWINEQRQIRIGNRKGKQLSKLQIKLLDEIGMQWERSEYYKWNEQFDRAKLFYEQYGHLNVSPKSDNPIEKKVAIWLRHQKNRLKNDNLSDWQIEKLNTLDYDFTMKPKKKRKE